MKKRPHDPAQLAKLIVNIALTTPKLPSPPTKLNPPGGVIRAGHFDRRRGSGGGSADRGLGNLSGQIGLTSVSSSDLEKGSTVF
jgi:hypothetical protein